MTVRRLSAVPAAALIFLSILSSSTMDVVDGGLIEFERVEEYHARNHQWPPLEDDYIPNTAGWRKIMERRFRQIEKIEDRGGKYDGYVVTVHGGLICPNFTENGWGLTRAPQALVDDLRASLHRGLEGNAPEEQSMAECIEGRDRPLFVKQDDLNDRAVRELRPIHEAWSGVKLTGNNAYGLRVYRNNSHLNMHADKSGTHIISSILHVDHDPESEPWPIVIEDFQGNTNEVVLESGDMLLYESSKCLHGRPRKFNGSWYSSLFTHYYPTDWSDRYDNLDVHYRIPPGWDEVKPPEEGLEDLIVISTSVKEPQCKDAWCGLENAVRSAGPGEYGKVLSAGGVTKTLDIPPEEFFARATDREL